MNSWVTFTLHIPNIRIHNAPPSQNLKKRILHITKFIKSCQRRSASATEGGNRSQRDSPRASHSSCRCCTRERGRWLGDVDDEVARRWWNRSPLARQQWMRERGRWPGRRTAKPPPRGLIVIGVARPSSSLPRPSLLGQGSRDRK